MRSKRRAELPRVIHKVLVFRFSIMSMRSSNAIRIDQIQHSVFHYLYTEVIILDAENNKSLHLYE